MVGINRKPPFGYKVFKGMVYVSVTNEFVGYVLEYLKTPEGKKYFKWIKWCFVPEDFFFQTIAMNSKYASTVEKKTIGMLSGKKNMVRNQVFWMNWIIQTL
jgi:hypothetical protein